MSGNSDLGVRAGSRAPVHATISKLQIDQMVERFYENIRADSRLGPIFDERIAQSSGGNWEPHLAKMKKFWASVLLKTGEYKGQPVVVHNRLSELREDDFTHWLKIFANTVEEIMEPDARELVFNAAQRIAQSLYLARFGSAGTIPPF